MTNDGSWLAICGNDGIVHLLGMEKGLYIKETSLDTSLESLQMKY